MQNAHHIECKLCDEYNQTEPEPSRKNTSHGQLCFRPSELNCWAILILSPLFDTMLLSSLAPVLII
jgi:hypothetical protein